MSRSSFRWSRFILDSIFTLIQAFMLSVLFLAILDLDFNFQIIIGLAIVAAVISIIHSLLCFSEKFFWKFAFLLPGDIYYYILAKSESKPVPQGRKILVTLPTDSDYILSKPDPDPKYEESKTEGENSYCWLKARLQGFFLKLSKILLNLSNWFACHRNVSEHKITESNSDHDKSYAFTWVKNGEFSENEQKKLINFLTKKFNIDWVKKGEIKKSDNEITIEKVTEKKIPFTNT
jgi:hypothetical protein